MGFWDTITGAYDAITGASDAVDIYNQAAATYEAAMNPENTSGPDVVSSQASTAMVPYSSGGGGAARGDVVDDLGQFPMPAPDDYSIQVSDLVQRAGDAIGKRLSAANIVRFVVKWGWQAAATAFRLSPQGLAFIVASTRAKPKRRRGPHLYTVLKRIRAGRRYEKMLARVQAKIPRSSGGRRRKPSNVVQFRRKAK